MAIQIKCLISNKIKFLNISEPERLSLFEDLNKLMYTKAPNPTETECQPDHYFLLAADRILASSVVKHYNLGTYIQLQIDNRHVSYQFNHSCPIFNVHLLRATVILCYSPIVTCYSLVTLSATRN